MSDFIVAESGITGGWYIYEQTVRGNYDILQGPFHSREDAEAALDVWLGDYVLDTPKEGGLG